MNLSLLGSRVYRFSTASHSFDICFNLFNEAIRMKCFQLILSATGVTSKSVCMQQELNWALKRQRIRMKCDFSTYKKRNSALQGLRRDVHESNNNYHKPRYWSSNYFFSKRHGAIKNENKKWRISLPKLTVQYVTEPGRFIGRDVNSKEVMTVRWYAQRQATADLLMSVELNRWNTITWSILLNKILISARWQHNAK